MFYVKGGTKTQRELTENVAMFAIKNLFPKIRKYFILIRLDKFNNCFEYDERDYVINIDKKQNHDDFVTAIMHEMVHVKQDYRKDKRPIKEREKEAYEQQEILFERWKNDN